MATFIGHIAALHHMKTVLAHAPEANTSDDLDRVAHLMPEMLKELGLQVGLNNALAISKAIGGTSTYIPKGNGCALSKISEALGCEQLAQKLSSLYGGEVMYIPRCAAVERALRDIEIHRAAEAGISSGKGMNSIVSELSSKHRLSDRRIWRILKKPACPVAALPESSPLH